MVFGYARVSSYSQSKNNSLEYQEQQLRSAGAEKIYSDVFSGKTNKRPQFELLLSSLKSGDKLIVTKLDRFARSLIEGTQLIESFIEKNITVEVLGLGVLDNSTQGKLIRNIMLSFAEFERELINERMQEGKAIAKQNPNYREGRPRKYSRARLDAAMNLLQRNSYKQVEKMTGISISTLQREKKRRGL